MITHGVDYVTEREAVAIRCNYGPLGNPSYNDRDMTIALPITGGVVVLPRGVVIRYTEDWRKSGLWSLPGLKPANEAKPPLAPATTPARRRP